MDASHTHQWSGLASRRAGQVRHESIISGTSRAADAPDNMSPRPPTSWSGFATTAPRALHRGDRRHPLDHTPCSRRYTPC